MTHTPIKSIFNTKNYDAYSAAARFLFQETLDDPAHYVRSGSKPNIRFYLKDRPENQDTLVELSQDLKELNLPVILNGFGKNRHDKLNATHYITGTAPDESLQSLEIALDQDDVLNVFAKHGIVWLSADDFCHNCKKARKTYFSHEERRSGMHII